MSSGRFGPFPGQARPSFANIRPSSTKLGRCGHFLSPMSLPSTAKRGLKLFDDNFSATRWTSSNLAGIAGGSCLGRVAPSCVCACTRACVHACVPACPHACMRPGVQGCVRGHKVRYVAHSASRNDGLQDSDRPRPNLTRHRPNLSDLDLFGSNSAKFGQPWPVRPPASTAIHSPRPLLGLLVPRIGP